MTPEVTVPKHEDAVALVIAELGGTVIDEFTVPVRTPRRVLRRVLRSGTKALVVLVLLTSTTGCTKPCDERLYDLEDEYNTARDTADAGLPARAMFRKYDARFADWQADCLL